MSGFLRALPIVLESEGGFGDHPLDRGGPTNRGITQSTYDAWRSEHGLPLRSVRELELDELHAIYHARYWVPARCDALPWPISLLHFDAAVNHGLGRPRSHPDGGRTGAVQLLQRAIGVEDDGIHGPRTQAAIEAADPAVLGRDVLLTRLRFYRDICHARPDQRAFLVGWISRLIRLSDELLTVAV